MQIENLFIPFVTLQLATRKMVTNESFSQQQRATSSGFGSAKNLITLGFFVKHDELPQYQ